MPNNGNVKLIAIDLTPAPTLSATPFSGAGSVASASLTGANVSSANAFGASTSLGGGTGTGQIPAQWYQLPLAASQSFDRLVTDRGSATGTGSTGASNANFSPPFRRSVRVVQADSSGPGWGSIAKRTPFA